MAPGGRFPAERDKTLAAFYRRMEEECHGPGGLRA
jgi:hypothetical protein